MPLKIHRRLEIEIPTLCALLLLTSLATRANAVTTTAAPTTDFDGAPRGNPPSIGAFEGGPAPDTTAPTVAIALPANGSALKALPSITAIATDETGGSGVKQVFFFLRRKKPDGTFEFWAQRSGAWGWGLAASFPGAVDAGTPGGYIASAGKPAGTQLPAAANLADGAYSVYATATDNANNTRTSPANAFAIDNTLPVPVTITSPADTAIVKSLASVTGAATDNQGGSGIGRVDLTLRRNSDLKYWSGTAWGTTVVALPTTVNGTTWQKGTGFPALGADVDTQLQDGKYFLTATPVDRVGNKGAAVTSHINLDRTLPPAATILAPANLASIRTFTSAGGSAQDTAGGSGIQKVEVSLRRNSDQMYWNGSAWQAAGALLPTSLSGTHWSKNSGWPAAGNDATTQLPEGRYTLLVSATDKAGNKGPAGTATFTLDRTAPTVAITAPANTDAVTSLATLKGSAFDALSGVAGIDLVLKRNSDAMFWDGASWVSTSTTLTATAKLTTGGNATWTYGGAAQPLPAGADLPAGSYSLTARSVDKAANLSLPVVGTFTVAQGAASIVADLAPSPVQLSAIIATATGRVQLVFTGALNAPTATDLSRYSAGPLAIESAAAATNTVTLNLSAASLRAGTRLTISYDLLDTNGLTVIGQATALVKQ